MINLIRHTNIYSKQYHNCTHVLAVLAERATLLSERTTVLAERATLLSERTTVLAERTTVLSAVTCRIARSLVFCFLDCC